MTCEKAEDLLSAYLDDMLAPQLHEEVAAHVEGCALCRETLADYRRFDALLKMERLEPSAALRDRIFDSPDYAAIVRSAVEENDKAAAPSVLRTLRNVAAPPGWVRGAVAAAVAVLVFGSALLIKQGLLNSGTSSALTTPTTPIEGNTSRQPLAAGYRVVFARNGSLWSAPESGASLAEQLTPTAVHVGAWSVSPDGQRVAYVDAATGHIHVIRSDDQNDLTTASVSITTPDAALVWSPDGLRIAYLAARPGDSVTLHLVNADGTNDLAVNGSQTVTGTPVWSYDDSFLVYVQHGVDGQTIWAYDVPANASYEVAHLNSADSQAQLAEQTLHWFSDAANPTVTWATTDGTAITGIFAASTKPNHVSAERLTPIGARYSAADFSASYKGSTGAWLVSSDGASPILSLISAGGTSQQLANGTTYAHIAWSPQGDAAALVSASGTASLWSSASGIQALGVTGASGTPAWSSDRQHVAVNDSSGVAVIGVRNGTLDSLTSVPVTGQVVSVAFAPDGVGLAISTTSGVTITSGTAALSKALIGPADSGVFFWSHAG